MTSKDDQGELFRPVSIGECLPAIKSPSRAKRRLIESSVAIGAEDRQNIAYQHTVFCQTGLPYRDPGDDVREWERRQGNVALMVEAGRARHPESGEWVKLGLPWGTKPRLEPTPLQSSPWSQNRGPVLEDRPQIHTTLTDVILHHCTSRRPIAGRMLRLLP